MELRSVCMPPSASPLGQTGLQGSKQSFLYAYIHLKKKKKNVNKMVWPSGYDALLAGIEQLRVRIPIRAVPFSPSFCLSDFP